jgi:magnesium chelatase family protein
MTTSPPYDFADLSAVHAGAATAAARYVATRTPFLLMGPPGIGKTMLARRVSTLLTLDEQADRWLAIEYGAGLMLGQPMPRPFPVPFRAPHYTVSYAAMCGEWRRAHAPLCNVPRNRRAAHPHLRCDCADDRGQPAHRMSVVGEVRLARFGVLFLDELADFTMATIEGIGLTLRAMGATAPIVIGSATPCPCGWFGSTVKECTCPESVRLRHLARLDRIRAALGMVGRVDMEPVTMGDLRSAGKGPSSADLRAQMAAGGAS